MRYKKNKLGVITNKIMDSVIEKNKNNLRVSQDGFAIMKWGGKMPRVL